jgi:predicted DNA-binding transcriptional regulator AlpA
VSELPVFLTQKQVDRRHPASRATRWRSEKRGLFPKRLKIAGKLSGYRTSEILEYESDPEGWARRHAVHSPQPEVA